MKFKYDDLSKEELIKLCESFDEQNNYELYSFLLNNKTETGTCDDSYQINPFDVLKADNIKKTLAINEEIRSFIDIINDCYKTFRINEDDNTSIYVFNTSLDQLICKAVDYLIIQKKNKIINIEGQYIDDSVVKYITICHIYEKKGMVCIKMLPTPSL